MAHIPHFEEHFTASDTIRDIIIGMSDGITVPFALTAGLSGAVTASAIVITAGFAEMAAGSISMGLGGYLAAKSDGDHYRSELKREWREIKEKTQFEVDEVMEILQKYGLTEKESENVMAGLRRRPEAWVDFMMRFELGLEKPRPNRARVSAITIGTSYIAGGLIPLLPYFFLPVAQKGLVFSVMITAVALFIFGWLKGHFTGVSAIKSAFQTLLIGGFAAGVAFSLARLFSTLEH